MIARHEAEVASRFDALEHRFKESLEPGDYRLGGILEALGPVRDRRILDLGCGKGRFGRALAAAGARVVGMDRSAGMLAAARGLPRVKASARRLPFRSGSFHGVVAVEVFEHLAPSAHSGVLREVRRILSPGGVLVVVDKNAAALNAQRPWLPSLAVKWIDERRGRWMYPAGGPVRERWFRPQSFRSRLLNSFQDVRIVHLLSPAESERWIFRTWPPARLMTLWVARAPGGDRE